MLDGIASLPTHDKIAIVVVSDHGMAKSPRTKGSDRQRRGHKHSKSDVAGTRMNFWRVGFPGHQDPQHLETPNLNMAERICEPNFPSGFTIARIRESVVR